MKETSFCLHQWWQIDEFGWQFIALFHCVIVCRPERSSQGTAYRAVLGYRRKQELALCVDFSNGEPVEPVGDSELRIFRLCTW
jgi:hypothetical protein